MRLLVTSFGFCLISPVDADDRLPQGGPQGVEKPLRISPRPENGRNSEGDFIRLKDGRVMLVYSKFVGKADQAEAELVARYSSNEGESWTTDDVPVVAGAKSTSSE